MFTFLILFLLSRDYELNKKLFFKQNKVWYVYHGLFGNVLTSYELRWPEYTETRHIHTDDFKVYKVYRICWFIKEINWILVRDHENFQERVTYLKESSCYADNWLEYKRRKDEANS